MSCTVTVEQGRLCGRECVTYSGKKYFSFEGIPYAKPPLGNLRFRDPQEPEPWSGILDATKPGPKCYQMSPRTGFDGSEDCLYLNVYTPCLPQEKIRKLPVIVFIHGGRFLMGHGDYYRPDYLIQNDVIFVTMNYRLHVLGFLCLNLSEVPGNAGLKDTAMAVRWVKKNITVFNGDSNNITVCGESAGAGIASAYCVSKMTEDLADKVIAQSGNCLSDLMMRDEDPIEKASHIASLLGEDLKDPKKLYKFLSEKDIEELVTAAMTAEMSRPPYITNSFLLPVVEKAFEGVKPFFTEYPIVTLMKKQQKNIPFLSGQSSHEGALFLNQDSEGNNQYIKDIERLIPKFRGIEYNSAKSKEIARNIHKFYFKNKNISDETKEEYLNLTSDALFNRDILTFCEMYSRNNDNLFLYHFSYSGNMNTRTMKNIGLKGATHGDIVQYIYYKKNKHEKCSKKDEEIVKFLTEAWCNFAKNGKPTWSNQRVEWVPYKPSTRLCLHIDEELSVVQYPYWNRIKFWLDTLGERSKL